MIQPSSIPPPRYQGRRRLAKVVVSVIRLRCESEPGLGGGQIGPNHTDRAKNATKKSLRQRSQSHSCQKARLPIAQSPSLFLFISESYLQQPLESPNFSARVIFFSV
jgi:hypothetical protein